MLGELEAEQFLTKLQGSFAVITAAKGLNFGDCFSYALARLRSAPLLFKGDDFSQTDVIDASH